MNEQHRAELKALEARMTYRELVRDLMECLNDGYDDDEGDNVWERRRAENPRLFTVANFHARGLLHLREANDKEAGERDCDESPEGLRHSAAEELAFAWGFAEELGNEVLIAEVLKDAKRNGEVYEAVVARLEGVRQHLETMRRIDELEARAGGG